MSTFVLAVIVMLAVDGAYSKFVCTPNDFSPKKTPSIVLHCNPQTENALMVLAIHIRRKTDGGFLEGTSKQENANAVQENPGTESANDQNVQGSPNDQQDAEHPQNSQDPVQTRKKRSQLVGGRKKRSELESTRYKRSSNNDFIRAAITAGNSIDKEPNSTRFIIDGSISGPYFLTVSIVDPDVNDVGIYECQCTTFDRTGNVHTSSEIVQVQTEVGLTVDDLEGRVKKIEGDMGTITELSKQIVRLSMRDKTLNDMVEEEISAMRKQIQDMVESVNLLNEQLTALGDRFNYLYEKVEGPGNNSNKPSSSDDRKQAEAEMALRIEEFSNVKNKLEHIETTQIRMIFLSVKELKETDTEILNRLRNVELTLNGDVKKRLLVIEKYNWQGIENNLNELEVKTIPIIMKNLTDCQRGITQLLGGRSQIVENAPEAETTTTTTTTPATTQETNPQPTFAGPACYVCGRNTTGTHCTVDEVRQPRQCSAQQPYCITDIYQDGTTRHVYKRCASGRECEAVKSKSSPTCDTDPFIEVTEMECHFCCKSTLCNDSLRPEKDLY